MKYVKSKVVMLPTEKASHILLDPTRGKLIDCFPRAIVAPKEYPHYIPQHLYILSNEDIKEGDWVYNSGQNIIFKWPNHYIKFNIKGQHLKKIIATTDESLTIEYLDGAYNELNCDPLPRPSNAFLKKYCELGGINEVLVEYQEWFDAKDGITPIELRLKVAPDNTITIRPIKKSWSKEDLIGNREGSLDYYLLNNPNITQEERELIMNIISNWLIENP